MGEGGRNGEKTMESVSIIYYTSNYLDDHNPYFLANTRRQLERAIADKPLIVVSQKPVQWARMTENVVVGDIGRSHLNIYWQILQGAKKATTKWVAMAEDDILYSEPHFNFWNFVKQEFMDDDYFLYDMNKVSIFTWEKQQMFSFRSKRMVVNQLVAKRDMLIEAMEERFAKLIELRKVWEERKILKFWGDPGRYEDGLGVTIRPTYQYYSWIPSIVFSHEEALGFLTQGKKKRQGDLRIIELADWGTADSIMKLYKKP